MATSGPRPGLGKDLSAITILYVNATFECFGRPLRLSEPFVNWADLRYALESCFGTVSNSSTYLRGYRLDHTELNAKELVPECLFVRRCVMPLGLRQYIPPEANVKYMKAKQDLDHVLLAIADESKAFEAYVNATDYTNYTEIQSLQNEKKVLKTFSKHSKTKLDCIPARLLNCLSVSRQETLNTSPRMSSPGRRMYAKRVCESVFISRMHVICLKMNLQL